MSFVGLVGAIAPQEWMVDALCAQVDADVFYPPKGEVAREAKAICKLCNVRVECLRYALAREERWGVWGGLSERERRRLGRRIVSRRGAA